MDDVIDLDERFYPRRAWELALNGSWDLIETGHDPNGRQAPIGSPVKRFCVLRERETGRVVTVGYGTAVRYAHIDPALLRRQRS